VLYSGPNKFAGALLLGIRILIFSVNPIRRDANTMPMQIPTKANAPACLAHALAHAAPLTIVFACPQH
jgi:hypothetical protein